MKFEQPIASKKSVQTIKSFIGDRWNDIRQGFNVKSPWFAKYCNLVERGLSQRTLQYGEEHHIVPFAWYKMNGYKGWRRSKTMIDHNVTIFAFGEHVYAHFCLAKCAIGEMVGKMAIAFTNLSGKPGNPKRVILPEEQELIDSIPAIERERIHYADPRSAKVRAEGRTNRWIDAKAQSNERSKMWAKVHRAQCTETAKKYRNSHPDYRKRCSIRSMEYNKTHPEEYKARHKRWRDANKAKLAEWSKKWQSANLDKVHASAKKYRDRHLEQHHANYKAWYNSYKEAGYRMRKNQETGKREWVFVGKDYIPPAPKTHEEKIEARKQYREENKKKISSYNKKYRENNKTQLRTKAKAKYYENHDEVLLRAKNYRESHQDEINKKAKEYRLKKIAAGYRRLTNPVTKKREWVFVGKQTTL